MDDTGYTILGDQVLAWSDLEVIVVSDIPVDTLTERDVSTPEPFIIDDSFRTVSVDVIQSVFIDRFISGVYDLPEASDITISVQYRDLQFVDRICSFLPQTNELKTLIRL